MSADAAADAFAAATAHWLRASSWVAIGEKAMQRDLRAVQKGCPSSSPRIRLGPGGDGGWTVCDTAALRAPECAVLSVGVGTDWRFDAATARHYNCSVVMLDPTPAVVDTMRADKQFDRRAAATREDPHTLFASLPNLRFEPWGLAERDEKLVMNSAPRAILPRNSAQFSEGRPVSPARLVDQVQGDGPARDADTFYHPPPHRRRRRRAAARAAQSGH